MALQIGLASKYLYFFEHKVVIYESTRSMLESSNQDLKQDIKEKIGMINDLRSDISNVKKDKENEISNLKREKENDISNLKRKKENLEISLNEITRKSTEYSEKLTNMGAQKDVIILLNNIGNSPPPRTANFRVRKP